MHDLTPLDQAMLTFETNLVAAALKQKTSCHKINSGALGNVVAQLHVHVVARNEGDRAGPDRSGVTESANRIDGKTCTAWRKPSATRYRPLRLPPQPIAQGTRNGLYPLRRARA